MGINMVRFGVYSMLCGRDIGVCVCFVVEREVEFGSWEWLR